MVDLFYSQAIKQPPKHKLVYLSGDEINLQLLFCRRPMALLSSLIRLNSSSRQICLEPYLKSSRLTRNILKLEVVGNREHHFQQRYMFNLTHCIKQNKSSESQSNPSYFIENRLSFHSTIMFMYVGNNLFHASNSSLSYTIFLQTQRLQKYLKNQIYFLSVSLAALFFLKHVVECSTPIKLNVLLNERAVNLA